MEEQKKKQRQGTAMFIYTALIFVVALILIIIAFFGQINRPKADNIPTQPPQVADSRDESIVSDMEKQLNVYQTLLKANTYTASGNFEAAETEIIKIEGSTLTEDESILYQQIITTINEGKEQ